MQDFFPPRYDLVEHALLLAAARAVVDPGAPEPAAAGADWDAFLALAARNRLLPLAHRLLSEREDVPESIRSALRAAFAENGRQALARSAELRRLIGAMAARGVRAAAYKGPALAVRAYGHLALRTYADLDLLVAPDDVPAAARVLEEGGYVPLHRFSPAQDAVFRRVDGDYPYHHPHTGALVELHCHVSSARFGVALPTAELLARARPVPIGGGEVPALADDDLFLALCLHGAKHRWSRLEWLAAAAALAVHTRLDLEAILRRASALGAGRTVLLALLLMRDALGLQSTGSIDRSISADPALPALAAEARALWFAEDAGESTDALTHSRTHALAALEDTAANLRFNYRLRESAADRARYAARWLFTPSPEDWAWARLPDPLSPLYRALRPLRLAVRYGPRRGA
ncbi:MAG TPA: nucleotidyltransferase family protein [Longimicrobium sp.]|nr:nucleotidyltransferase family protein [Longimicrobium sp.]